ncbi:GNAT family N-acetyltransferase [Clostridium botulinum]|nr:GNAT family N-acetyltransferase [Clostridium botulinum]NFI52316.1 GNAT family N-acetyltransferase [Clostridium botulinum]
MNEELKVEPIILSEAEKIRDIMVKIVENESLKWFKNGEKPFIPNYNSIDMQRYHTWDKKYYKIIYSNDIVGVILVYYTGREHARIDRFYILPEYQNRGIGSKVIKMIEELFQEVNLWSLDTIQQSPRNHHFYEKNGYVLIGQDINERYYCKEKNKDAKKGEDYLYSKDFFDNKFRECNMKNVDLYESNMSNAKFSNMNLSGNIYANSNLSESRFTNTNMSCTTFGDSNMSDIEICHASLSGSYIHDINLNLDKENCSIIIERCELTNSKIIDSNLQNLRIEDCNIQGMVINGIKVIDMIEAYKKYTI